MIKYVSFWWVSTWICWHMTYLCVVPPQVTEGYFSKLGHFFCRCTLPLYIPQHSTINDQFKEKVRMALTQCKGITRYKWVCSGKTIELGMRRPEFYLWFYLLLWSPKVIEFLQAEVSSFRKWSFCHSNIIYLRLFCTG